MNAAYWFVQSYRVDNGDVGSEQPCDDYKAVATVINFF